MKKKLKKSKYKIKVTLKQKTTPNLNKILSTVWFFILDKKIF